MLFCVAARRSLGFYGLAFFVMLAPTLVAQPLGARLRVPRAVLANGLEVVVLEEHSVPLVTIDLTLRAGANIQPPEASGLAHFLEHMVLEQSDGASKHTSLARRLRRLGATYNGFTIADAVAFTVTVPREHFEPALRALADAVQRPTIEPAVVERERRIVLDEWRGKHSHPYARLERNILKALWGNATSRRDPPGERAVLERASVADLRALHRQFYVPNQTLLAIAGDVDFDEVLALGRSVFGSWEKGSVTPPTTFEPLSKDQIVIEESDAGDVHFVLGFRGPDLARDRRGVFAGMLLSIMANGSGSSFHRRIAEHASFIDFDLSFEPARTLGIFRLDCQLNAEDVRETLDVLVRELTALGLPHYFLEDELRLAKAQFVTARAFARETTRARASEVGAWWRVSDFAHYKTYEQDALAIRRADVAAFVQGYVARRPLVLGLTGPKQALQEHALSATNLAAWLAKARAGGAARR